jgi:hypothetical protein
MVRITNTAATCRAARRRLIGRRLQRSGTYSPITVRACLLYKPVHVSHTDILVDTVTKPKRKSLPALPRMKSPSSIAAFPSPVPEFAAAQSNDSPDAKLFEQEQPMVALPMKATSSHGGLLDECDAFAAQFAHAPNRREVMRRHDKLLACLRAALELSEGEDYERVRGLGEQLETLEQESAELPLSEGDYLMLTEKHASLLQRTTALCKEYQKARDGTMLVELGTKREELKKFDISCCQFRPGTMRSGGVNLYNCTILTCCVCIWCFPQ